MEVEICNNTLIIKNHSNNLKTRHISQLTFWGLKHYKEDDSYRINVEKEDLIILKLHEYFKSEQVLYKPSSSFEESFLNLKKKNNDLEKLKIQGGALKEGNFDDLDFRVFCDFISKNVSRKLKTHQIKAAYHLYKIRSGANFSVPGSGKTTVVLSVYEKLRLEKQANLIFVVGPPSCFGPWQSEFKSTLNRDPRALKLAGNNSTKRKSSYYNFPDNGPELYLTSFHSLYNDQKEAEIFFSSIKNNIFLVIDEAHYIKQIGGVWANTILSLAQKSKFRCILTGTPMPNKYTDLFNLFDFLWPNSTLIDEKTKITIEQYSSDKAKSDHCRAILRDKISPFFYRVRKSDLGLIPAQFHPPDILNMNKYEKIIYDAVQKKIRDFSKDDYLRNIELVERLRRGRIIRLRQCVSYPKLISRSIENYTEEYFKSDTDLAGMICDYDDLEIPAKLVRLKELVEEFSIRKEKLVIWANFIGTLELINQEILNMGLNCKMIYGRTPTIESFENGEETREQIRDEFVAQDSGLDILIANPAACSESISLHKTCFHAIYYDLSFNCAQYLQSLDRIHRIGGSENNQANYYFLQYENSIDQLISENLKRKAEEMYSVIEDDCSIYSLNMFEDDSIEPYKKLLS
jgi:SNF2 family DNA or RNA helicase